MRMHARAPARNWRFRPGVGMRAIKREERERDWMHARGGGGISTMRLLFRRKRGLLAFCARRYLSASAMVLGVVGYGGEEFRNS